MLSHPGTTHACTIHPSAPSAFTPPSLCNKFGQTIVLVTHDPKVASAADRVLFMRDGSFVEEAPLRQKGAEIAELVRLEDGVRRSG